MKNNAMQIKYKIVPVFPAPKDCQDYLWEGYRQNGLYTIYPQKGGRLNVYCDQQTDGGGWTVISNTGCLLQQIKNIKYRLLQST